MVRNAADCQHWLELLDWVAVRCGWRVFAWVLMTNHFHLYLPGSAWESCVVGLSGGTWSITDESVGTIGAYFGGVGTPAISQAVQRAELRRSQDRAWERQLKRLMEGLRSSAQSAPKQLP
jgi:hypothetical protein